MASHLPTARCHQFRSYYVLHHKAHGGIHGEGDDQAHPELPISPDSFDRGFMPELEGANTRSLNDERAPLPDKPRKPVPVVNDGRSVDTDEISPQKRLQEIGKTQERELTWFADFLEDCVRPTTMESPKEFAQSLVDDVRANGAVNSQRLTGLSARLCEYFPDNRVEEARSTMEYLRELDSMRRALH